jgi:hypothetical protein
MHKQLCHLPKSLRLVLPLLLPSENYYTLLAIR